MLFTFFTFTWAMCIASLLTSDASMNKNYEYEEELPTGAISHTNPNVLKHGASGSHGMRVLVRLGMDENQSIWR